MVRVPDDSVKPPRHRFPRPWRVAGNDACYWVEDAEGKKVAYCYFLPDDHSVIGISYALQLTRDEARRIARNIARLPELLTAKNTND